MNNFKLIGVAGLARSGKDTFCNHALCFLADKGITCTRKAFADRLKKDLLPLGTGPIGINPFTGNPKEKEIIRPLLVAYGTDVMRKLDPKWWIRHLENDLEICRELKILPIITDVRYPNEIDWIQKKMGGVCVHVSRIGNRPPNKEERTNNPILRDQSDYRLRWPTYGEENLAKGQRKVNFLMNKIYKHYLLPKDEPTATLR
tara:strand:- start:780 stop:1385 length:606 start_codon:yes stop_codon:yes gene_type:complete